MRGKPPAEVGSDSPSRTIVDAAPPSIGVNFYSVGGVERAGSLSGFIVQQTLQRGLDGRVDGKRGAFEAAFRVEIGQGVVEEKAFVIRLKFFEEENLLESL
jgi:hypothetical protein